MQRTERAKTLRVRRTATYIGLKRLALLALCAVFSDPISAVESKGQAEMWSRPLLVPYVVKRRKAFWFFGEFGSRRRR